MVAAGWSLAARMLRRDLRAGELTVMLVALVVAIAAMSSVGLFTDRVARALEREADQMLAADLVMSADQPIPDAFRAEAKRLNLALAQTTIFPSMVQIGDKAQLTTIKAVTPNYPLRGKVRLGRPDSYRETVAAPSPGTAWGDQRLFDSLGLKPGDTIVLGERSFRIVEAIQREPDAAMDLYNFVPRLLIPAADVASTGLIQTGSRIRYRLLLAGPADAIKAYRAWAAPKLQRGQRIEDVREARPEVRTSLERSERFLRLSALVSVFLAAASISLAARRYVERHLDPVALLRTLGASQRLIVSLFLRQYVLLALLAGALGLGAGVMAHFALVSSLATFVKTDLPPLSWWPALSGFTVGVTLLFGFCLPPLLRLQKVSPLRVIRRDLAPAANERVAWGLGALVLCGLIGWQAGDAMLAALALAGMGGTILLSAIGAWLLLWLSTHLALPLGPGFRFGVANLARRRVMSVAQIVALSLGIMALLLLVVVRGDLLSAWARSLPPDAPNRFGINIQPDQRAPIASAFRANGMTAPTFAPMIRARLLSIGDKVLKPDSYKDERARNLAEREFNLSWGDSLRKDNRLVAGRPLNDAVPEFSVEESLAERLGIKLGDRLVFMIDGRRFEAPVTSLRKVNWDSFQPNFFVVGSHALLGGVPASYLTSFHVRADKQAFVNGLVRTYPNLTIIDVTVILNEVRSMLTRAAEAIEYVFAFSLLAGLTVLYAATLSTQDERRREAAILRTLGASSRVVWQAMSTELLMVGGVAGVLAGLAALLTGALAASKLFELGWNFNWYLPVGGLVGGAAGVLLAAWPLLRKVLATPPLRALNHS